MDRACFASPVLCSFRTGRRPDPEYVDCGVQIAVVTCSACRASPFARAKVELVQNVSARRARFARRIETRDGDRLDAEFERGPSQDGHEIREAEVAHLATPQTLHRVHIQVFERDERVFFTEFARELEVVVAAPVRDALVLSREVQPRSFAVFRPLLFARKLAVGAAYPVHVLLKELRGDVFTPVRADEEVLQTEVETDGVTRSGFDRDLFRVVLAHDVYIHVSET